MTPSPVIAKVTSVRLVEPTDTVCDLTISPNHNLFVSSEIEQRPILAHNCLDENRSVRQSIRMSGFTLEQIGVEYGYLGYYAKGEMSKAERIAVMKVPMKRLAKYGVKDVCVPYQICKFQQQEAKRRGSDYDKFLLTVTVTISNMIHSFVAMERNGLLVDRNFLLRMMAPNSGFQKLMAENDQKMRESKNVIKANEMMLKNSGAPQNTMFAGAKKTWVLDLNKPGPKQILFFDVLGLEPLAENASGGGKVDKRFKQAYEHIPEVALLTEREKVRKLYETYIVGFYNKLSTEPDMKVDNHLRPNFTYLSVVTGRASAKKPSLHQVPSRDDPDKPRLTEMVKNVKRQFIAPPKHLYIKADFSAHEVRNWAIIGLDTLLSEAFRKGLIAWRNYRVLKEITEEIRHEFSSVTEKNVDIHRVNYQFFYGKPASEVNKTERQSIKAVVFGVIYGKGPDSLGEDISIGDSERLRSAGLETIALENEIEEIERELARRGK